MGLLEAERSSSNYRYYEDTAIERIHLIEEQKANGKSLEEIRQLLQVNPSTEEIIDVHEIRLQMKKLEKDVTMLMEQMDSKDKQQFKKKVSPESVTLIQSLLLLLT